MEPRHEEETEPRGWFERLYLIWPMLFLVGWVLYELTTQPTVGAVAVCLKFGWEDFRAAIWLRRRDPWRLRGCACFWLYLASGLAKTAGVSGLMSFAFACVSPQVPAAQGLRLQAMMEMAIWTFWTTLVGLSCAFGTFGYAIVLALWGGFKLWLSRDIHRARCRNDWPPYGPSVVPNNHLESFLICALFVAIFPLVILFCIVAILLSQINEKLASLVGVGSMLFLMFAYPVLILLLRDGMHRRIIASHPCECWEAEATSLARDESMAEMSCNPIE